DGGRAGGRGVGAVQRGVRDGAGRGEMGRHLLLDEGDVPPRGGAELSGVVVRVPRESDTVLGDEVPLLARHLAGLAADAHGGVGEEALARRRILVAAVLGRVDVAEEGPTE